MDVRDEERWAIGRGVICQVGEFRAFSWRASRNFSTLRARYATSCLPERSSENEGEPQETDAGDRRR